MVLIGGANGGSTFKDVLYYNIDQKLYETPLNILPVEMGEVKAVIFFQLDSYGCKLVILMRYPANRLYICDGNYKWKWFDTKGIFDDQWTKFAVVGANELLPCGID